MLHNMLNSMSSLGGGLGLAQMQGMGGLGGMNGMNMGNLGQNPNLPNHPGQGLNSSTLGNQGFPPQGLGVGPGLGNMIPNLQNLQAIQTLQSLGRYLCNSGGLVNMGGLGGYPNNSQMQNNMNMNDLIRNQL